MAKRKAAKRELINTAKDKRFVRRGTTGKFKESDDVGPLCPRTPAESFGLCGTVVVTQHATYPLAAANRSLIIRWRERPN
jgi:hypothetical protein